MRENNEIVWLKIILIIKINKMNRKLISDDLNIEERLRKVKINDIEMTLE